MNLFILQIESILILFCIKIKRVLILLIVLFKIVEIQYILVISWFLIETIELWWFNIILLISSKIIKIKIELIYFKFLLFLVLYFLHIHIDFESIICRFRIMIRECRVIRFELVLSQSWIIFISELFPLFDWI